MRNGWFESEAERKAFYERQSAFWNRPASEVMGDLVYPSPGKRAQSVMPNNVISLADYRSQQRPKLRRPW